MDTRESQPDLTTWLGWKGKLSPGPLVNVLMMLLSFEPFTFCPSLGSKVSRHSWLGHC